MKILLHAGHCTANGIFFAFTYSASFDWRADDVIIYRRIRRMYVAYILSRDWYALAAGYWALRYFAARTKPT